MPASIADLRSASNSQQAHHQGQKTAHIKERLHWARLKPSFIEAIVEGRLNVDAIHIPLTLVHSVAFALE